MPKRSEGLCRIGVKDNEVLVFSELMDAKSLFLTANADTVYFVGGDRSHQGADGAGGAAGALGTFDDAWWRWVIDFGAPGPDRGEGGKYLILPPGYDGPLPEGGFYVCARADEPRAGARAVFMVKDDPKPTVALIKAKTKIYPYEAGGAGTSIADFLTGKAGSAKITPPPPTVFHEGSGKVMNTIPPNDYSYYEMLNEVVQREPATALDPELMGPLAAIGIVKGKPFAPDARMKKILTEALAVANATSRSLLMNPRDPSWYYYPGSSWIEFPLRQRLRVRDADPDGHARGRRNRSRRPATARSTRARRSSTALPASRPRWPCACPVSVRNTSSPCWMRTSSISTVARPTR